MSKKLLLLLAGGAVAALTVLAGGYYAYTNVFASYDEPKEIAEAIKDGKSLKCEVEDDEVKAVFYIDAEGKRTRIDIEEYKTDEGKDEMKEMGMARPNHVITDKKEMMMWSDEDNKGLIFPTDNDMGEDLVDFSDMDEDDVKDWVADEDGTIKCKVWRVKESMFDKPDKVDFTDFGDLMKDMFKDMSDEMGDSMQDWTDEMGDNLDDMMDDVKDHVDSDTLDKAADEMPDIDWEALSSGDEDAVQRELDRLDATYGDSQ